MRSVRDLDSSLVRSVGSLDGDDGSGPDKDRIAFRGNRLDEAGCRGFD